MGAGSGAISGTVWDITPRPELLWRSLALWSQMTWVQILSTALARGAQGPDFGRLFPIHKMGTSGNTPHPKL